MSQIKNTEIEGSVAIGRHATVGGDASVRGSAKIHRNLRVCGWLDAPNIKGADKGMFLTVEALEEAYPHPEPGWKALVGDSLPAPLYVSDGKGWNATGKSAGNPTIDSQAYESAVKELRGLLEDLEREMAAVEESANAASLTADAAQVSASVAQASAETALTRAQEAITKLTEALEVDSTDAIDNLREVLAFLEGIKDDESLAGSLADLEERLLNATRQVEGLVSDKVDKIDGMGLSECSFSAEEKQKLAGLENYVHPAMHPASMIEEDSFHRFVTDELLEWMQSAGSVRFFDGIVSDEAEAADRYGVFLVMPADGLCYFCGDFAASGKLESDYNFDVPHAGRKIISPGNLFVLNADDAGDDAGVYLGLGYTGRVIAVREGGGSGGDGPGCTCEGLTDWQKSFLAQQEEADRQGKYSVGLAVTGVTTEYTGTELRALLQATTKYNGEKVAATVKGTTENLSGVVFDGSGSATVVVSVPATSTGRVSDAFTVRCEWNDGHGILSKTASATLTRYAPIRFLSKGGGEAPTSEEITAAVQKQVKGSIAGTYQIELTPGEYVWVCVPSFLTASGFTSGGFAVPMEAAVTVPVVIGGTTVTYRCHRTSGAPAKSPMSLTIS